MAQVTFKIKPGHKWYDLAVKQKSAEKAFNERAKQFFADHKIESRVYYQKPELSIEPTAGDLDKFSKDFTLKADSNGLRKFRAKSTIQKAWKQLVADFNFDDLELMDRTLWWVSAAICGWHAFWVYGDSVFCMIKSNETKELQAPQGCEEITSAEYYYYANLYEKGVPPTAADRGVLEKAAQTFITFLEAREFPNKNEFALETDFDAVNAFNEVIQQYRRGRIIELPVAVGETAYKVCTVFDFRKLGDMWDGKVIENNCDRCGYKGCGCHNIGLRKPKDPQEAAHAVNFVHPVEVGSLTFLSKIMPYWGEIWFSTEEEAQAAIAEFERLNTYSDNVR